MLLPVLLLTLLALNLDAAPAPRKLATVELDLDAPPGERWAPIAPAFKQYAPAIHDYFASEVPAFILPLVEKVAGLLPDYFGTEYAAEMMSFASLLNISVGEVVLVNLVMQVESVGLNCSNWNNTGPTKKDDPGCTDIDPSQSWCYCKAAHTAGVLQALPHSAGGVVPILTSRRGSGPGMCTSIVTETNDGRILHARNLDWNLPAPLLPLLVDVRYMRGGKPIAIGTGAVGFVGVFNGMVPGAFSASINARGKGGKLIDNLLQALRKKSLTPSQHLRDVLTKEATTFSQAVDALSIGSQIDENYFTVAGAASGEGAVVSRGRDAAVDVWPLNTSEPGGWYRLQTNYDHWNPVPSSDDRRTPGKAMMSSLGRSAMTLQSLWGVLTKFPIFNDHTDYSGLFEPAAGTYNSTVWI